MNIKDKIVDYMESEDYIPMKREEISKRLGIGKEGKDELYRILSEMEDEGRIYRNRKDKYGLPENMNLAVGRLIVNQRGYGFLVPDNKTEEITDVFISPRDLNGAMNGDRVIAKILLSSGDGKKREGEIRKILKRANEKIVGVYEKSKNFGFVVPSDNRITEDIFIPKDESMGAKNKQIVEVEITRWGDGRRSPEGKVVDILGNKGDAGIDIVTIVKKYGLPEHFPDEVENEAESITEEIPDSEISRRTDFRDQMIFTIDGADAMDFDDGVSIERTANGNYKLGVHIADVTYYVKENKPLDKEAIERGTSVYLVDRVIPMLPKKLSNGVCSLNPKVDRLALSVIMEIDKNGKVRNHEIVESVINSKERLVYEDVSDILENDDAELKAKYAHILDEFKTMEELCKILMKKRRQRGSIDFDFPETKVVLDEKGKPIDISEYERRIANRIIEEFMLVTNETVAEYMHWSQVPFLYRIHEDPDLDKMQEFAKFIYNFGYKFRGSQEVHPRELQELLKKVEGTKEEHLINTIMLRSLKKARYSAEIDSHFGLAAEYYTHFTSPIRRYPDLQIHRIIKWFINGQLDDKKISKLKGKLPEIAELSSDAEKRADEAERETDDLKKAEFMLDKIGEEFDGVISGVISSGLFIELPNTVEGFVHVNSLKDDYYKYDERSYALMGERTKRMYRIGDGHRVRVTNVNIDSRQVDFIIVEPSELEEEQLT
jgi:ribonuclease R